MMVEPAASFVVRPGNELAERLRNAIAHLGDKHTTASVLTEAVRKAVEDLEREHNNGQPFPVRPAEAPRTKPSGEIRSKKLAPPAVVRERQRRERDGSATGGPPAPRRPAGPRPR